MQHESYNINEYSDSKVTVQTSPQHTQTNAPWKQLNINENEVTKPDWSVRTLHIYIYETSSEFATSYTLKPESNADMSTRWECKCRQARW